MSASTAKAYLDTLPEWQPANKQRLTYLFSNFVNAKDTNPESFDATVGRWHGLLRDLTPHLSRDQLVLHANASLIEALTTSHAGRPLALGAVLEELANSPPYPLVPLKDFLRSHAPLKQRHTQSWSAWAATNLISKPLWWGLKQAHIIDSEDDRRSPTAEELWKQNQGDWVFLSVVEIQADAIIRIYEDGPHLGLADRLYSFQTFREKFFPKASPLDLQVILRYLERDRNVLRYDESREIVKYSPADASDSERDITDIDQGIAQVYANQLALKQDIIDLQKRIQSKQDEIAKHLRDQHKDMAMSALRSKKALQDLLSKRSGALETIDKLVLGIETATGDLEIVKAYQSASETLRKILNKPELQSDTVAQTMDDVSDILADQQEIDDLVTQGSQEAVSAAGIQAVDEDELERELAELTSQGSKHAQAEKEAMTKENKNHEDANAVPKEKSTPERDERQAIPA